MRLAEVKREKVEVKSEESRMRKKKEFSGSSASHFSLFTSHVFTPWRTGTD
jgi:hypothetical protein